MMSARAYPWAVTMWTVLYASLPDTESGNASVAAVSDAGSEGKGPVTESGGDRLRPRHLKLVAEASRRLDIEARGQVRLDFSPQALHVDVDSLRRTEEAIAPCDSHQLIAAQDSVGILHKGMQQGKLSGREGNTLTVDQGMHLLQIEGDLADRDVLVLPALTAHLFRAPKQRVDVCHEELGRDRLDHVV